MVQEHIVERIRKLLALTTSPVEGEALAAAAKLQELLIKHNLSIADLEERGQQRPDIRERNHDLGKAAFHWKLQLAEAIAGHFFCLPMVNYHTKTVNFVGRPDNVESLHMLYGWVIDQIKRIASEDRKQHQESTGEHVDPLRWQVAYGTGAVSRLRVRLEELRQSQTPDTTALVVHHEAEISDYLEERYGFRRDGRMTRREQQQQEEWRRTREERERMRTEDPEMYFRLNPWDRPKTEEQKAAEAKERAAWEKRQDRNERRRENYVPKGRRGREWTAEDQRREDQRFAARSAGRRGADRVNLQPFLGGADAAEVPRLS